MIHQSTRIYLYQFMLILLIGVLFPGISLADEGDKEPPLPAALQTLSEQGAQIRYLGESYGMKGWVTIKNGQEQYFYATPDGEALVMGLLFDKGGKMITLQQVNELRKKEGDVLDMFALNDRAAANKPQEKLENSVAKYKTPAEQLYSDLEASNWVVFGYSDAPVIYSFIDPQCPHCQNFTRDLKDNYIGNGLVQLRVIPVGFREETLAQASFLLAAPDPEERWYRHLEGDEMALPVTKSVNQQGVQRNMAIMQSWQFGVTPLSVYRAADGSIKIVQGRVKDIPALIADLP